jgi:hypothetical protein
MGWFRIELTEEQQQIVNAKRDAHPQGHVRRKMLVLWLLHCGLTRAKAAAVAGLGRATEQRYVAAFRAAGPGHALCPPAPHRPPRPQSGQRAADGGGPPEPIKSPGKGFRQGPDRDLRGTPTASSRALPSEGPRGPSRLFRARPGTPFGERF